MTNFVDFNGAKAELVSTNRGWSTIRVDGMEQKVRGAKLAQWVEPVTESAPKARKSGAVLVGSVIRKEYKKTLRRKVAKGKWTNDIGDEVAVLLRGLSLDDVYAAVAKHTGNSKTDLLSRFSHLNNGMQRMTLGNFLRHHSKESAE